MTVQSTYSLFAKFYDAYVGDYAQDLPFYLALASKVNAPILEIGCGSGRVLLPLLRAGHAVTGVDISKEMLQLANDKLQKNHLSEKCTFLNHNFVDSSLPQEFGLALVTFYTFNYLLSPDLQQSFLTHVGGSLRPGAFIVLHLFYPNVLLHPETAGQWIDKGQFQIDSETVVLKDFRRMLDEHTEERLQTFDYESGGKVEIRTLRRYVTQTEIYRLLISVGFGSPVLIEDINLQRQFPLHPDTVTKKEFVVMAQKK
jgi:SAM-dependent methyltransferase